MNSPPKESVNASLEDISVGREIAERETHADARDALEASNYDNEMLRAQVEALKSRTTMREGYERKVYKFLVSYSFVAAVMLFLCGFKIMMLPENVLLAIAGSTAVAAIGLVAQIGKGLFGSNDGPPTA